MAKRYTELTSLGADAVKHRPVMRWYRPEMLRIAQVTIGIGMLATLPDVGAQRDQRRPAVAPGVRVAARRRARPVRRVAGRRTVRPVEDLITRDVGMLCCEAAWLILFCVGLYVE